MDTRQIIKWTVTFIAVMIFQHANATTAGAPTGHGNSMPDHIAYFLLMQHVSQAEQNNGHTANVDAIEQHLSLDREHAEQFLHFMLDSYSKIVQTDREVTNRMLCSGNKPKYNGNQAYQVLDVLADIKETNLRRYYHNALVDFGDQTAHRLNTWLVVVKDAPHQQFDRQSFFEGGSSLQQVLGAACNVVASN